MISRPNHDWDTFRKVLGDAPPPDDVDRRIVDGVLEGQRRRRVTLWAGLAAVAAACLLVALWLGGVLGRGPDPTRENGDKELPRGAEWAVSNPFNLDIGPHRVDLAAGARLRFLGGTTRTPQLEVSRGKVGFTVSPLEGGSFTVRTRHALVAVLGTRFSVELEPRCTRVEVTSGTVRVEPRRGGTARTLGSGEGHSACEPAPAPVPVPKVNRLDRDGKNVLRAIRLIRKGERLAQAETLLADYLERRPDGSYAQEALFFLVLVKKRLGKLDEARTLARDFLRRFPSTSRAKRLRRLVEEK